MKKERVSRPRQKGIYRIRNWGAYDAALVKRGSVTVWMTPEAIAGWYAESEGSKERERKRGGEQVYSDIAIQPPAAGGIRC